MSRLGESLISKKLNAFLNRAILPFLHGFYCTDLVSSQKVGHEVGGKSVYR